jgi:hypothetical protein
MFCAPACNMESADMAHYYFDLRDGEELVVDEEGMELRNMRAVQDEAARALAGFAWDAMRLDGPKVTRWQSRCATSMAR